jgi:Rps23 Pro-64 3,4-dihydroxylase Tpa1-like proline 4-hydroxylase
MINDAIDPAQWRAALAARSRVQIPQFLQPDAADALAAVLDALPWALACRRDGRSLIVPHAEYAAWDADRRAAELATLQRAARAEYAFAYDSYQMVTAYRAGRDPDLPLHRVLEFLNSAPLLAFARALTGEPAIRRASAQATRYRPGQFLLAHDDSDQADEGRLYAYVINLTRAWRPDWGGLLQFLDADERVVETFVPRRNSLSLFRVPQRHCVSLVAPWAGADRLSITGWFQR